MRANPARREWEEGRGEETVRAKIGRERGVSWGGREGGEMTENHIS